VTLIRCGKIVTNDRWIVLDDAAPLPAHGDIVVSPQRLLVEQGLLLAHDGALGVAFAPNDDPASIASLLPRVALASVAFPGFRDGRAFTIAHLLRDRHGFKGEIRAVGDVLRDQLFFMIQCGFDAFLLKDNAPLEALRLAQGQHARLYGAGETNSIWLARAKAPAARVAV
jgi:uncharacterized protein (DUF934 family)